ncbi:MAG: DUF4197 domain-containing protein [Opitutales bacterium]
MNKFFYLPFLLCFLGTPLMSDSTKPSWFGKVLSVFESPTAKSVAGSAFADTDELAKALRETLAIAAERAVKTLSQAGGFTNSELFRIPLPAAVESFRKPLALVQQEHHLDGLEATMNRAAEAGVAAAPELIKQTIQNLSLEDLNQLWKGESDAVTRFLEKHTRKQLSQKMLPLIAKATDSSGATRTYKKIQAALPQPEGGLFSKLQGLTGIGVSNFDLDQYVNEQALNALFAAMAAEEKEIRENPKAQTTELLKKLFDSSFSD